MKPVIICGGIGSKMWPVSRSSCPKHFAKLLGEKSLFQINYNALRLKFRPEEIYVQTNQEQALIAQEQVPEIPKENYFIEPEMRNQGPATGFAAAMLFNKFPDEPFMLVQADVMREPPEKFIEMVELFDETIRREGRLMTAGLKPDFAVMGVDYLIVDPETHRMQQWLGRGEKEVIEGYLKDGKALIHTNHYAWTPRKLLECLKARKPEWYGPLMNIVEGGNVVEEYAKMPKGPIEEVTQFELLEGLVVELPFVWRDFGTWESLASYLGNKPADSEINSRNNFVWPSKRYIATIGVEDLVIVDTPDALLVMKKNESGTVGQVVDKLKEEGNNELL